MRSSRWRRWRSVLVLGLERSASTAARAAATATATHSSSSETAERDSGGRWPCAAAANRSGPDMGLGLELKLAE